MTPDHLDVINTAVLRNIKIEHVAIEEIERGHGGRRHVEEEYHLELPVRDEDVVGPSAPPTPPHGPSSIHGNDEKLAAIRSL